MKIMEALEVYLVIALVLWKVWSLKELIYTVFKICFIFEDWAYFVLQIIIVFHWRTEKSVDFLKQ